MTSDGSHSTRDLRLRIQSVGITSTFPAKPSVKLPRVSGPAKPRHARQPLQPITVHPFALSERVTTRSSKTSTTRPASPRGEHPNSPLLLPQPDSCVPSEPSRSTRQPTRHCQDALVTAVRGLDGPARCVKFPLAALQLPSPADHELNSPPNDSIRPRWTCSMMYWMEMGHWEGYKVKCIR